MCRKVKKEVAPKFKNVSSRIFEHEDQDQPAHPRILCSCPDETANAWDESESKHFAHAGRHSFSWRGPYINASPLLNGENFVEFV